MRTALRIALVDDQALIRAGLRALLQQQGIEIVFEAADGAALLEQLAQMPAAMKFSTAKRSRL